MSKQYRWCEASGPVPYPNDTHRMLDSYDVLVSGDGWAALAELGFVEEVEAKAKPKKAAVKPKKETVKPKKEAAKQIPPPLPEPDPAPVADNRSKTVSQMVKEVAAKSKDEPATVIGQAKKVLSKRKTKSKAKSKK